MAEVGPDGHVWVLDWYNFIVQHNPTPAGFKTGKGNAYETDLRDKKHGRVYRVVYKKAKTKKIARSSKATPKELVAALKHDNMRWRLHAQRLLVERGGKDVVPELVALIEDKTVDDLGLNVGAIHALWTLHGLLAFDDARSDATRAAVRALTHPSPGVRRAAVAVLAPPGTRPRPFSTPNYSPTPTPRFAWRPCWHWPRRPRQRRGRQSVGRFARRRRPVRRPLACRRLHGRRRRSRRHVGATTGSSQKRSVAACRRVGANRRASRRRRPVVKVVDVLAAAARCRPADAEHLLAGLADGVRGDKAEVPAETEKALVALLPKLSGPGKARLLPHRCRSRQQGDAEARRGASPSRCSRRSQSDEAAEAARVAAARQVVEFHARRRRALSSNCSTPSRRARRRR